MDKDEEIRYLKFLLSMVSKKMINLTKPYDLTINEIQQEVRSLEQLREILLEYKGPVDIHLEPREFGKRK